MPIHADFNSDNPTNLSVEKAGYDSNNLRVQEGGYIWFGEIMTNSGYGIKDNHPKSKYLERPVL